jgi:hypothetical protein
MHRPPQPPGQCTAQAHLAKVGDGGLAADGREAAEVPVHERTRGSTPRDPGLDDTGHIVPALLGRRDKTRHRTAGHLSVGVDRRIHGPGTGRRKPVDLEAPVFNKFILYAPGERAVASR